MRTQPFPDPDLWTDGEIYYDSVFEAQLQASLEEEHQKQKARLHEEAAPSVHKLNPGKSQHIHAIASPALETPLSQLMAGCGIAAVDGYLQIREYAATKGLDLIELHHKGIDLQDLLSTLIIHTQRMAEMEGREAGARRWKR